MKRTELEGLLLEKIPHLSKHGAICLAKVPGIEALIAKEELPPNPMVRVEFRDRGPQPEQWYRDAMIEYLSHWIEIPFLAFPKTAYDALADYCEGKVKK